MRFIIHSTVFLSLMLTSAAFAQSADWWDSLWPYRQRVFLNTSQLEEDLRDFPLALRFEGAHPIVQLALGRDEDGGQPLLRIIGADNNMLLSETIRWGPDGVELVVLLPHVAADKPNQFVDLYYGNSAAQPLPSGDVWDDAFRAVFHLDGDLIDAVGGVVGATAVDHVELGNHAHFSGDRRGFLQVEPRLFSGLGDQITLSVRFRMEQGPGLQTLVSGVRHEGPEQWFNFGIKTPDTIHTNATSEGRRAPELNPRPIAPGSWHSAVIRYDAVAHTRTIAIDGEILQSDSQLPGPLAMDEMRVGRGVLHFEPWQFHGAIDEVRIAGIARSDAWLLAESASLAEGGVFVSVGPPEHVGGIPPAPAAFRLLAPGDGLVARSRDGVELRWTPSAWAERYTVALFDSPVAESPTKMVDVGGATRLILTSADVGSVSFYWTVLAQSNQGSTRATEVRGLQLYDWSNDMTTTPEPALTPALDPAQDAEFRLEGYLRERIDRVTRRYLGETPESSPAMLQVLRDRDKRPVRDPLVPWAGEFAGKYLTAAQLTWRLTRDEALQSVIDKFVRDLIACQDANGYLGPFPPESRLTGGNWDVWGHYHCMLGLMLYFEDTGYEPALDACRRAADLLFETFGPGGPTLTCDGSGGEMNMAVCHGLMLLYAKTGQTRYRELAEYIVNDAWNEEGAGHYLEFALAGRPIVEMPRHRWESIHDWQALAEFYWLTGDDQYRRAFEHLWRDAVRGDRHNTGGLTTAEGFQGTPYQEGAIETCCTVAWIAFSVDMLRLTGDSRVADEIEWSTLNSALGSIPYSGRACAYNVPMDGTRTFGVELPWQAPKAGPDLNCCAVNANRPLGMIAQWALMEDSEGLALNYYGPGRFSGLSPSRSRVTLIQETDYPRDETVSITVKLDAPERFALKLRMPSWSANTSVNVNGEAVGDVEPGSYLVLDRTWESGDVIELRLDFGLRLWPGQGDLEGRAAVYRGPLLLAFDARYNDVDPDAIPVLDVTSMTFEGGFWTNDLEPWMLATLSDDTGAAYAVCDFSSAGQTGNHYRTWLPVRNLGETPSAWRDW
jgi:uncharacterized protein